jgi:hypothetical protein
MCVFPTEAGEGDALTIILEGLPDIGDSVFGKPVEGKPGEAIAFMRLFVGNLPTPSRHGHKEIDAFVAGDAVHHLDNFDVLFTDIDPNFFPGLADGGGDNLLAPIEVPGDNAVIAVFVAGVVAAEEEDLIVLDEEEVDGGFECGGHGPA